MATSWSVKIVLGCLSNIVVRKVSKSQTNDLIVSLNINATQSLLVMVGSEDWSKRHFDLVGLKRGVK
jgi:hypothetical protein